MVNVTDANATALLKESSLEAIDYICQEIVRWIDFSYLLFVEDTSSFHFNI